MSSCDLRFRQPSDVGPSDDTPDTSARTARRLVPVDGRRGKSNRTCPGSRESTCCAAAAPPDHHARPEWEHRRRIERRDRKSTRLNSSHITISYAVFCLKKKKQ